MAFLGSLFKKKPGGTLVGNLLRGAASNFTGGILGSGANRIEYGQTQTNAELAQSGAATVTSNVAGSLIAGAMDTKEGKELTKDTIIAWLKANWIKVLLPGLGLVALVVYLVKRGRRRARPYRR